ncbi:hypothetical protein C8R43DRAFT_963787 [Mycena crocata]|nr:hypothetical protein C8R43DRAFT_963787 [Mycena crocata]
MVRGKFEVACLAGYPVKPDALEEYRKQHGLDGVNLRPFVQHLGRTYNADELNSTRIPPDFEVPQLLPGAVAGGLTKLLGENRDSFDRSHSGADSGVDSEGSETGVMRIEMQNRISLRIDSESVPPEGFDFPYLHRAAPSTVLSSYNSDGKSRIDERGVPIGGGTTEGERTVQTMYPAQKQSMTNFPVLDAPANIRRPRALSCTLGWPTENSISIVSELFDKPNTATVVSQRQTNDTYVELKWPSKWTNAGKVEAMSDLTQYIEGRFDITLYSKIYGLGGIGLHWMACAMEKAGLAELWDWEDDFDSGASYVAFEGIAELVYNIQ